jgi:hypothetical protein
LDTAALHAQVEAERRKRQGFWKRTTVFIMDLLALSVAVYMVANAVEEAASAAGG